MEAGRKQKSIREAFHMTDLGNAQRFVELHGENVRFCHAWNKWFTWDGVRWVKDETGAVVRMAKETALSMYGEAMGEEDDNRRRSLVSHALNSEGNKRIAAMLELARSEQGIPILPEQFDADPWLLNCMNGTVDLRTGELKDHCREDIITKLVQVRFNSEAMCQRWEQFLSEIMGNDEHLVAFLKRMIGYSLTGSTREQFFLILHGVGGNGKSTLIEILKMIFGDYSTTSSMDAFIEERHGGGVSNDIARLRGARLVSAIETDAMKYLAEGKIKALTGQDMISARFLFQEFFEFIPQFKLWLACNHKPIVKGTDHAIWRRIRLVPFEQTFDPKLEPNLKETLESELEGIFAQAVSEAVLWYAEGIRTPPGVVDATGEYRTEMDVLGGFLEALCEQSPQESEKMAIVYGAYEDWCLVEKEKLISKRAFGIAMRERGFRHRKSGSTKYYCGIRLRRSPKQETISTKVKPSNPEATCHEGGAEEIHVGGTDGTDQDQNPIPSPIRARVRSIGKKVSSVPSVPTEDTGHGSQPQMLPEEYQAKRLGMTTSESRLLTQIQKEVQAEGGDPVPFLKICSLCGLNERYVKDMITTARKAGRLTKARSEPEPAYLVTKEGLKAVMEHEVGITK